MRLRRTLIALATLGVVAALAAGVFTGVFASVARAGLYATGLLRDGGRSTVPPGVFDTPARPATSGGGPSPNQPPAALPSPVLLSAKPGPVRRAAVEAKVAAVAQGDARGRLGAEILDVGTGKAVYRRGGTTPLIPASTMKLLTSAAALSLLGPEHRFTTTVVQQSAQSIVLVGGGDPYLTKKHNPDQYPARASVADLAAQTARELLQTKHTRVRVGYDSSLFTGSPWNPRWPASYADQVTRTAALWVDEGRVSGSPGRRVADPAKAAADAFAAALRKRGITVTRVEAAKAGPSARRIAAVSSMPVERIVEQLLLSSDNDAAEVLLRHAGLAAQRDGSMQGGVRAVRARLGKLGVWDDGSQIHDGSGLARQTKVSAETLVKVLRLGAENEHPELRALITGLPVAGVEGSLRPRFFEDTTLAARGVVRGKTGTLRKVHTLAGFVRTADGSMLVYAFLVNDPKSDYAAQVWLDKVSAAVASCGCR